MVRTISGDSLKTRVFLGATLPYQFRRSRKYSFEIIAEIHFSRLMQEILEVYWDFSQCKRKSFPSESLLVPPGQMGLKLKLASYLANVHYWVNDMVCCSQIFCLSFYLFHCVLVAVYQTVRYETLHRGFLVLEQYGFVLWIPHTTSSLLFSLNLASMSWVCDCYDKFRYKDIISNSRTNRLDISTSGLYSLESCANVAITSF